MASKTARIILGTLIMVEGIAIMKSAVDDEAPNRRLGEGMTHTLIGIITAFA